MECLKPLPRRRQLNETHMTDPINDGTISPSEIQAIQRGEGEAPAEVVPAVVPEPKVETPAEPKVEDPAKVEPKIEEPKEPLAPKRSIYDDLKEKKVQVREAKEEVESMRAENARLAQELETLKQAKVDAKTPVEKQTADEEIAAFAESIGAEPEAIAGLIPILEKRLNKGETLSKEDLDFIKQVKAEQQKSAGQIAFNNEWDGFAPSLKAEFPHVSDADLASVRKEVERLAHTPEFHDKEIDYIYFKTKNSLSKLISPKRSSIDGGGAPAPVAETPVVTELSGKMSPMDVQNAIQKDKNSSSSLEVRAGQ